MRTAAKTVRGMPIIPAIKHTQRSAAKQLTHEVQRKLTAKGMTSTELRMLERLYGMLSPEGLVSVTGTYLAKSLGICPSMACRYLRRFEQLKLIKRLRHLTMPTLNSAIRTIKSKISASRKAAKSLFLRNLKRIAGLRVSQRQDIDKRKEKNAAETAQNLNPSDREAYWLAQMGLTSTQEAMQGYA